MANVSLTECSVLSELREISPKQPDTLLRDDICENAPYLTFFSTDTRNDCLLQVCTAVFMSATLAVFASLLIVHLNLKATGQKERVLHFL